VTAARTPSQSGAYSRRKGVVAERDLCRWLRVNGFGQAERAVRTAVRTPERSVADPGDITGTGLLWSVKDCGTERLRAWFGELDAMEAPAGVPRLLAQKRAGHADPAQWWCWMRLHTLLHLALASTAVDHDELPEPVRMELGHVVPLLRTAGWGDAMDAPNGMPD
jgi:hypothetical protein